MPLPKGLPKEAFEQPKIASWASGAPLGSQGPFWRPSLDFAGRIFGLGSSLGPFLDASGTPSVFFSNFLAPSGIIFSKSLDITFVLQADEHLELYISLFFQIWFPTKYGSAITD